MLPLRTPTVFGGEIISHGQVSIEPVKALHGHLHGSVFKGASFGDCGYLIRDGHSTIFHPMHYDTYAPSAREVFWTIGDPEAVRRELADEVKACYRVLAQGERLVLEP